MAKWKLPEGREPLLWRDMPFADRPKAHPSTERLEIEKLKEQLKQAREDALREALDAAREYRYRRGEAVENAILALIEKDADNG